MEDPRSTGLARRHRRILVEPSLQDEIHALERADAIRIAPGAGDKGDDEVALGSSALDIGAHLFPFGARRDTHDRDAKLAHLQRQRLAGLAHRQPGNPRRLTKRV